jgi:hypothetical protein
MSTRCCPICKSKDVRRSMRRGKLESLVLPFLLLRPFRCESCDHRYYGWFFSKRVLRQVARA